MSAKTYKKVSVLKLSTSARVAAQVVEVPLREPSENEILVRNLYAGVNATDMNIIAGRYLTADGKLPFDIGLEYIRPDEFKPLPGNKPEYLALLDCGLTATIGLDHAGHIAHGETVLITAAAGGTGHIGVQWAKRKGCHVIGLSSAPAKIQVLKELGCDRVINYRTENLDEVLSREYKSGIDVIWETIGGQTFETLFKHLAVGGRLVIVGSISGYKYENNDSPVVTIPDINMKGQHILDHIDEARISDYTIQYLFNVPTATAKQNAQKIQNAFRSLTEQFDGNSCLQLREDQMGIGPTSNCYVLLGGQIMRAVDLGNVDVVIGERAFSGQEQYHLSHPSMYQFYLGPLVVSVLENKVCPNMDDNNSTQIIGEFVKQ
ncbi:unnamed protein product [Oppiella nova]|uniref:Enoyl reductase (ER) domain-containing protein n=1 Tax=Oppiella nova TaxID=334625 RepID=A0A7R9LMY4_9ACAR|nr:unnamed protein product [Oppiella nova]CAG2164861.1 unnamed protein product [Oppiella nova]